MTPREQASAARTAQRALFSCDGAARSSALHRIADALLANADAIAAVNGEDVAAAEGYLAPALLARLPLPQKKLTALVDGIRTLADAPDPVGTVLRHTVLADGLELRQRTSPLGVLLVIFEARPDALPQVASLALKAGNGVLLKGGTEARRTNRLLHRLIVEAIAPQIPAAAVGLVETREEIADLLALDDVIDLVIPRGSSSLVRHIQQNTRIPVLGHSEGICHVYVDAAADLSRAIPIVVDAKTDYPAACNAMETLLVHEAVDPVPFLQTLRGAGVSVFGGPRAVAALGLDAAQDLHHEYSDLACALEIVSDLQAAIDHVHRYGSGHTDCILTEDASAARTFLDQVDSACVFHNASTRFADGYRFGLGAEVGISTSRLHARGPVGVEGLLTTRWVLEGSGDTVAPFSAGERTFRHERVR